MKLKKNNKNREFAEKFATIITFVGVVLLFISIWMNGWYIIRVLLTGLLLIAWGYLIFNNDGEKNER